MIIQRFLKQLKFTINQMHKVKIAEHLYEIYPSMPRYANDPQQSQIVKTYDFILRRFQGFFGKQPSYFIKAGASPLLLGDQHTYSGYPYLSFSSTQDIIVAIAKSQGNKIKINNYQSAIYGQKVIDSCVADWKFNQKDESQRFTNIYVKILSVVAEQLNLKDLGGLDILIYTGFIEDQFMAWKQALFSTFYSAVMTILNKGKEIEQKQISNLLSKTTAFDSQILCKPQLTNYKYGYLSIQGSSNPKQIALPPGLNIVIAHSMTPLPKKLIQGKRFNLRRCEILIAIEYLKSSVGTTKEILSLKQLQDFIGCTIEELIKQLEENIPKGKLTSEQIEQFTDKSLIDILREIPYANNVIDQNTQYFPRDRALFFLKEDILLNNLTVENFIETISQSHKNQVQLLGIQSQQISQLIQIAKPLSLAHKIVGNGWGGNVIFFCQKDKTSKLIDQIVNQFYLSNENRVLLSDDIEQYIHVVDQPTTGLAILNPQSQIWY